MIKAVVDTNTIVSATISPKGLPGRVYRAWLEGKFTLVTSPPVIAEIARVLNYDKIRTKYGLEAEDIQTVLALLWSQAQVTQGALEMTGVAPHQEDDKLISCAVEGEADFIVTGDKPFQARGEFEGIRIISPRLFLELLEGSPN